MLKTVVIGAMLLAGAGGFAEYASDVFLADVTGRKTGFFHVEKGGLRWNVIDPLGRGFVPFGVDHCSWWGMQCEALGHAPYGRFCREKYGRKERWVEETCARLKSWGFNTLGGGDWEAFGRRGILHTVFLEMGKRHCRSTAEWRIAEDLDAPGTAFPNVFHPDFEAACDRVAKETCAPQKDDPLLLGYFLDNELAWWGSNDAARDVGIFDVVAKMPPTHTARQALDAYLAGREATREIKLGFLKLTAERYFSCAVKAIRRHDPNHMIMGCRFAGLNGAHPAVWAVAGKYCDIVTFNIYPWVDLDRNVVLDARGGVPIVRRFEEIRKVTDSPIFVTEWSFPALDTGRPCLHGEGQRFRTQHERVQASSLYVRTMLAMPNVIGYDYFMWVDQPALGMRRSFPEDSNYGLVNERNEPYVELVSMFAKLHADAAKLRCGPVPASREAPDAVGGADAREFRQAARAASSGCVSYREDAGRWTLANDAGLALRGRLGGSVMVDEVVLDGKKYGSYGGLLEYFGEGGESEWIDAEEVLSVRKTGDEKAITLEIESRGGLPGRRFSLTHRVTVAAGERDALCEIVGMRNESDRPIKVKRFFMRPFAAVPRPAARKSVPNLWKGGGDARWEFPDGRRYGMVSQDPAVERFFLWVGSTGVQHPDVKFTPGKPLTVAAGAAWSFPTPPAARLICQPAAACPQKGL